MARVRHLFVALAVGVAACGGDRAELRDGSVTVELSAERGLVIRRDGAVVLASHLGSATRDGDETRPGKAYAPFAAGKTADRRVEEIYGFFRFREELDPYRALALADIDEDDGVIRFALGEAGRGRLTLADGVVRVRWQDGAKALDRLAMTFACAPGDRFFGLGAQVSAEHRGFRVPIWTTEQGVSKSAQGEPPLIFGVTGAHYDSYAPVPFLLSSRPVGLFLAADAWSEVEACESDERLRLETWADEFELVVYAADSMQEALEAFTAETGRPDPLPNWSFGPWVDTFGGPAGIDAALTALRSRHIPASAVWSEDWVGTTAALGGENLTYDWQEDPSRYPDLAATAAEVHAAGFRFLVYVNPFLPPDAEVHAAAAAADVLVDDASGAPVSIEWPWGPPVALFDPSAPGAASFFTETLGRVEAKGVDGWMADYGEALPYDARPKSGILGPVAHNRFPIHWAELNKRFWQTKRPDGDWAIFSRSGHTGIAAATHIHWLGDQMTSFDRNDGLGSVVPLYLSAGLSGISLTHSDVGGYTSFANTVRTHELFARWLELEAFTPFLRTHHTSNPANNLQWHSSAETLALVDTYFRWHQALTPYFANLVRVATDIGAPAVRPVWWDDEGRAELYAVDDAFLTGADLLVAPIVVAGQTERALALPSGAWRRWPALAAPLGPPQSGTQTFQAAIDEAIVLVRAGAGIPLLADEYDTLAPTRPGETLDAGLTAAPAVIRRLRLLLVGGGEDIGGCGAPGIAAVSWRWQGADVTGPLVAAELDGAAAPACDSPTAVGCLDGTTLRLGAAGATPVAVTLRTAAGAGTLQVSGTEHELLLVEVR